MTDQEKQKMDELLAGEFGGLIKSFTDSRVSAALKTRSEKEVSFPKAAERLQAIEQAATKRIRDLELKLYATRRCHETRIDLAVMDQLGLAFADEADVDKKLATLADAMRAKEASELNDLALRMPKPGMPSGRGEKGYHGLLTNQERLAVYQFEGRDMT